MKFTILFSKQGNMINIQKGKVYTKLKIKLKIFSNIYYIVTLIYILINQYIDPKTKEAE